MTEPVMEKVIDRLAALFEWGALLAATNPPGFMDKIANEIERLRRQKHDMLRLLKEAAKDAKRVGTTGAWLLEALNAIAKAEGRQG